MKKFYVEFNADPLYLVEANTPTEAYEQALEWFNDYLPNVRYAEVAEPEPDYDEVNNWSEWQTEI